VEAFVRTRTARGMGEVAPDAAPPLAAATLVPAAQQTSEPVVAVRPLGAGASSLTAPTEII